MANYSELIATINDQIKANGNQEITGPVLNSVLQAMVSALGEGYQFMGVATPGTNPGTPDGKVFYIATEPGTYSNFNNIVNDGNVVALYNTASGWTSIDIGSPSKQWTVENIWYVLHGIFSGNGNLAYLIKDGYINSVGRLMLAENGSSVSFRFTVVIIPIKNNQKLTSNADYQYNAALYDADFNVIPGSLKTGQNQTITGTAESVYAAFSFTSALYGRQIVQEGEELTITDVSNPIANYVDLNLDENSKRPIANSPVALNFRNTVKYVDSVNYLDVAQAFKYLCVKSYNYEQYEVTIQRVPSRDETSDRRVLFYVWNRDTGEKAAEFVYNLASVNFITENIYMYEDSNVKVVFDYTAYSRSTFGTIHKTDLLLTYQSFLVSEMSPYQGRKYCSLGSSSTTYPWLETAVTGLGFNFNGIGKGGAHLYMDDDAFYADNYQSLEASSPANVIMNQVAKLFKLNSDSGYYPDVITLMSGLNDCYATLRGTFEDAKNANLSDFMEYYGWIKPYADHTWIYTKSLDNSDNNVYDGDGTVIGTVSSISADEVTVSIGGQLLEYSRSSAADKVKPTAPVDWFTHASQSYRNSTTVNLRAAIEFISRKFPYSQIIIVTFQRVAHPSFVETTMEEFIAAEIGVAGLFSLPVIDFYKKLGLSVLGGTIPVFSEDGLHPNTNEATVMWANFMATELKRSIAFRR